MRVLIIGASGMLGHDLQKEWTHDELIPASSRDADIRDPEQVRKLVSGARPDAIVLAAAYTDVDGSERNSELAFAINGQGAENVARAAAEIGAPILYVSTDYLYDGTSTRAYEPADAIAPLNVYGESKAAGEAAVRAHAAAWCIVRTSWLFGAGGASFPEKILRAAETRPELTVVADQTGSPTFTRDLAGAIRDLVRKKAEGVVNVTNSGSCTWCEFAAEVLRQAGRGEVRVTPITTEQAARLAKRPRYSVLGPTSLHAQGITLRSWQDAVTAYLQDLRDCGKLR
jgi:dTDP-4-dehydrorhamnose reductase